MAQGLISKCNVITLFLTIRFEIYRFLALMLLTITTRRRLMVRSHSLSLIRFTV